jgi:hypothetical protein
MENGIKNRIGGRFSVIAYVDPTTFKKLESVRGDVSRSRYVSKLLVNSLNNKDEKTTRNLK